MSWTSRFVSRFFGTREYERDRLNTIVFDELSEAIEQSGLSRADLARKLGTSRSYITQLLRGDGNPRLSTIADIAWACNARISVSIDADSCVIAHKDYIRLVDPGVVLSEWKNSDPVGLVATSDGAVACMSLKLCA